MMMSKRQYSDRKARPCGRGASSAGLGYWDIEEWRCEHVFQWEEEVADGLFARARAASRRCTIDDARTYWLFLSSYPSILLEGSTAINAWSTMDNGEQCFRV